MTTASTPQAETFRDGWMQLALLSGLAGPNAQRFGYSMAIQFDGAVQATLQSVYAAMPSVAPDDALPYIGIDRQITRGYQESDTSYVSRLQQWLDRWAYAGKPTGVLMACIGWTLPTLPTIRVVTNQSRWFSYTTGTDPMPIGVQGSVNVTPPVWAAPSTGAATWNWDGNTAARWRSWLIVDSSGGTPFTGPPVWGSFTWGSFTWGLSSPNSTPAWQIAQGYRNLVRQWKAAGAWYPWIVVSFNALWFRPTGSPSNLPDGNYGRWSKIVNGQYVPARSSTGAYISGTA